MTPETIKIGQLYKHDKFPSITYLGVSIVDVHGGEVGKHLITVEGNSYNIGKPVRYNPDDGLSDGFWSEFYPVDRQLRIE